MLNSVDLKSDTDGANLSNLAPGIPFICAIRVENHDRLNLLI